MAAKPAIPVLYRAVFSMLLLPAATLCKGIGCSAFQLYPRVKVYGSLENHWQ